MQPRNGPAGPSIRPRITGGPSVWRAGDCVETHTSSRSKDGEGATVRRERCPTRDRIQRSRASRSGHMPRIHKKTVTRSLAAGLAVCAIAPGAALAMPAVSGPPAAAGSSSGVTAQDYRSLDYRAAHETGSRGDGAAKQDRLSDQTDGGGRGLPVAPAGPSGRSTLSPSPDRTRPRRRTRRRTAASTPASGSALGRPRSRLPLASASRAASAWGPAASISRHSARSSGTPPSAASSGRATRSRLTSKQQRPGCAHSDSHPTHRRRVVLPRDARLGQLKRKTYGASSTCSTCTQSDEM